MIYFCYIEHFTLLDIYRNLVSEEMSVLLKNTNITELSHDRGAVIVGSRTSLGVSFLLLLKKSLQIGD